jgi:hypothetical protein
VSAREVLQLSPCDNLQQPQQEPQQVGCDAAALEHLVHLVARTAPLPGYLRPQNYTALNLGVGGVGGLGVLSLGNTGVLNTANPRRH